MVHGPKAYKKMKKFFILLLIPLFLFGCQKDELFLSTPLLLTFPVGKPWKVKNLTISDTIYFSTGHDTISLYGNITNQFDESDNMFFKQIVGSDPNAGSVESYYINGTWKSEVVSNNNEYLVLNFPTNGGSYHKYSFIGGYPTIKRWRITDKWTNEIRMTDDKGNYLIIVTG